MRPEPTDSLKCFNIYTDARGRILKSMFKHAKIVKLQLVLMTQNSGAGGGPKTGKPDRRTHRRTLLILDAFH